MCVQADILYDILLWIRVQKKNELVYLDLARMQSQAT